jgi:hypothetical protein
MGNASIGAGYLFRYNDTPTRGTLLPPVVGGVTIYKPLFLSFIPLSFLYSDSPLTAKAGTSNNNFTYLFAQQHLLQPNQPLSHRHNVRLQPLPERVCVRQCDGLLRHLDRSRFAHPTRQGWSFQLPPCHQEGWPYPMAPYSWHEDLDAPASPPPTVLAVAVSSSQDDRGFTQVEESFTIISSTFMRNVATSANALRHDYSLHALS